MLYTTPWTEPRLVTTMDSSAKVATKKNEDSKKKSSENVFICPVEAEQDVVEADVFTKFSVLELPMC